VSLSYFKTPFAERIYLSKYSGGLSWHDKIDTLVENVCRDYLMPSEKSLLKFYIEHFKFVPAGRYLYYAEKPANFYNNCFCLKAEEDTREEWGRLVNHAMLCLMSGGGIGVDYSAIREEGKVLHRTGGVASGPIPLMKIMNEAGRNVMQGGSRRSALFASLKWDHPDCPAFITSKNWSKRIHQMKTEDFNFPAPLDMTNITVNYDDDFLKAITPGNPKGTYARMIWDFNILQMLMTAEPGMAFNFGKNSKETLRNACSEFISEDDSDVCNLGSVNLGAIESLKELKQVTKLASAFLVCGGHVADLPYDKVYEVRAKNRSIGLGLMGVHEWLLKKNYIYQMNDELDSWLSAWKDKSEEGANLMSDYLKIKKPKRYRAVAPTGTIGILASTTTGIVDFFGLL